MLESPCECSIESLRSINHGVSKTSYSIIDDYNDNNNKKIKPRPYLHVLVTYFLKYFLIDTTFDSSYSFINFFFYVNAQDLCH